MKIRTRNTRLAAVVVAVAMLATACSGDADADAETGDPATGDGAAGGVAGEVIAAGSSTVLPVAEYVLELYRSEAPDVDASYTSIGSGGGFERLCELGDVDLSGASRAIKDSEAQACADNGIEILELQFGIDALTMVTSTDTDYLECFTTDDIIETFGPDGATTWDQVVDGAPADPVEVFAPDTDSGTYGFMVEDVMGLEESRQDYSASADDNVIVQGIQSGTGTWGFFGLAYYESNADGLKALAHQNSDGDCVEPSITTAEDGTYELVRPLFIYVRTDALADKPQVADFVDFFLQTAPEGVDFVGYVNSPDKLAESREQVAASTS